FCVAVSVVTVTTVACAGPKPAPKAPEAVPVTVGVTEARDVPVEVRVIGHVEAFTSVAVRPRVGGEVLGVSFKEGQDVSKGDLLFTIDPRTYQADLDVARANLERDRARAASAREDARRYATLVQKDYVTKEQYDQIRSNAEALAATVKANEAAVQNATLQLGYTTVRAPISGRAGSILVHPGNLVKANDDRPLVLLNQVRPILATFSVPEANLPEIQRRAKAGTLAVLATPSGESKPSEGTLSFVDNAIDTSTGTVSLKAAFPNPEGTLWPGQFVNVALTLSVDKGALVIPTQAVQTSQKGPFVYVVKQDLTVETRPVVVARSLERVSVISKGLAVGERVVTDGQLRLSPGAKVDIHEGEAAAKL
ncbi:MAG: efflux RND transporter periplasmic adaptor subunit, partial [Thermoanaerobaculia bacterium]